MDELKGWWLTNEDAELISPEGERFQLISTDAAQRLRERVARDHKAAEELARVKAEIPLLEAMVDTRADRIVELQSQLAAAREALRLRRRAQMCACSISYHLSGCEYHDQPDAFMAGPGYHIVACKGGCVGSPRCPDALLSRIEKAEG